MYILILKLWPSAYIKAFVQIRKEEIIDATDFEEKRIKIYKANDLTAQQWSQSYKKYTKIH